jgi:hypothetical protein
MTTSTITSFEINGVIDTSRSVLDNLETLASAANSFFTLDTHEGKWCIVINKSGTSTASFDDSNIIGPITLSGSGLTDFYNKVVVTYPSVDLIDQKDTSVYEIDAGDRYDNEPDNVLEINYDIVNNPVQAEMLALTQLKQSRVDKVIKFQTDYSYISAKAGDIIDVTSEMYGFSSKLFRIINIEEEDGEDGAIRIGITALEYDADVYDYTTLSRFERTPANAIKNRSVNTAIANSEDISVGGQIFRMLAATMVTDLLISSFTRDPVTGIVRQILSPKNAAVEKVLKNMKAPPVTITGPTGQCENSTVTLNVVVDPCACMLDTTAYTYNYTITGVDAADITPFPLTGTTAAGAVNIPVGNLSTDKTLTFTINGVSKSVSLYNSLGYTYFTSALPSVVTEGGSSTVTLTTTNVANGTVVPYAITGAGTGRVSTPLTGSVTVNSNTATLSITTINDGVYTGDQSITVTFNGSITDNCGELDRTVSINILDNETAPPANYSCTYVSVPVVWCGVYNGSDNQLTSVTAAKSAMFAVPQAGEATVNVPTAISVTKGNPSTITVTSTVAVASANNLGGTPFNVIYNFNSVVPNGLITGSHYTIYGY